jgi:hypothetical protein
MAGGARNDLSGDLVNLSLRRLGVMTATLVALLALTATAAFAQYPPARGLELACERSGNQVVCVLAGAASQDECTAVLSQRGREVDRDTQTTDDEGEAEFELVAQDRSAANVRATCVQSAGAASDTVPAAQAATGTTGPGSPLTPAGRTLPVTGLELSGLVALALGLIGVGVVALRRRDTAEI